MIELVSGEIFVNVRIRAGSRFGRFLCFVFIDARCLRVPPLLYTTHTGTPTDRTVLPTG
jgi:hypothetical protein